MSGEPLRRRARSASEPSGVEDLVSENLGLVYDAARRLNRTAGPGPEMGDLISAGVQGLIQAAHSFDPSRGLAFSTLAVTRVRGAMLDELRRWDQTPRSVRRKEREIRACEARLGAGLGRAPTSGEVADALGVSSEELHEWLVDMKRHAPESLDAAPGSGSGDERARAPVETIADDSPTIEETLNRRESLAALARCIPRLPERQGKVLALYYYEGLRLREIAQILGVTESRISQVRHAALKDLRALLHQEGIEP